MYKKLKIKLLLGLFLFLALVFSSFGYFFVKEFKQAYNRNAENLLSTAVKDLRYEYNYDINNSVEFENVKKEFAIQKLFVQITIMQKGQFIQISKSKDLQSGTLHIDSAYLSKIQDRKIYFSSQKIGLNGVLTNVKVVTSFLERSDSNIIIQCAIPFEESSADIQQMQLSLIASLSALLAIILFSVYIIISKSLSATKEVTDAVKRIEIDGQKHEIKMTGIADEIDEMIATFNYLINELQISYQKVKEFGHNASHELKTPLTIMKGEVEFGLSKDRNLDEYKNILKKVVHEVDSLNEVIEKILFLSSSSEQAISKKFSDVYVDEILDELIVEKNATALEKNILLKLIDFEATTIQGNAKLLKIAIGNILDNAIKYSYPNGIINVSLRANTLYIQDFGSGIATQEGDKIFDRFYRQAQHLQTHSGSGLGLSITKTILDAHHFPIHVKSTHTEGTVFTINFEK